MSSDNVATLKIFAPKGYGFVRGRSGMLIRFRSKAEEVARVIKNECARIGWHTKKIRATEIKKSDQDSEFYLRIGPFRGLLAGDVYNILKLLPSHSGRPRLFFFLSKLTERVH